MTTPQQTLAQKLQQLRLQFVQQLPSRLEQLQQQHSELTGDVTADRATLQELHRTFHSLKGAGRSFGFNGLALPSGKGESLLANLLDNKGREPVPSAMSWQAQLNQAIEELAEQINEILQGDSKDELAFQAPFFEMSAEHHMWQEKDAPLIYICDDEAEHVEHLEYQLRCFGYLVQRFTDIKAFESAVLKQQPDAVVMDIHFPQGNVAGTDTLARINERLGYQLPSIVLSGMESFAARLSAYRAGCRSYFTKPAKSLELADALDELVRKKPVEPYQILIVDDEPAVAEYHSLILQEAGMLVRQVHNPTEVLDVLTTFTPDLVLVDVYMPECTGQELAGIIRQMPEYIGTPIIYLSSETDRQKQFSAMQVGVEGFITKPVVPHDLVAAVQLRAARMRALRSLMTRDSLTGLYNHTTTTEIISAILAQAERGTEQLVVAVLDLDHFKRVNDNHGHLAGDQVLMALSRMLRHRLRHGDIVGRFGGEEFVILLRDISTACAEKLINTLREEFSRIVFSSNHADFHCTFSAGLATYPKWVTADQLIGAADRALYQAKFAGRNQVKLDTQDDAQQH